MTRIQRTVLVLEGPAINQILDDRRPGPRRSCVECYDAAMSAPSQADLYLARLAAKSASRWTIYTVFTLTAIASLYEHVGLARSHQVLPWYGSVLGLYGAGMAALSRDNRSRIVYGCFGLLVATAF